MGAPGETITATSTMYAPSYVSMEVDWLELCRIKGVDEILPDGTAPVFSCTNDLNVTRAITKVSDRLGQKPEWFELTVRDGDELLRYTQTGPHEAQYTPPGPEPLSEISAARHVEMANVVGALLKIAQLYPDRIDVGSALSAQRAA